jgi:hypothetical protein
MSKAKWILFKVPAGMRLNIEFWAAPLSLSHILHHLALREKVGHGTSCISGDELKVLEIFPLESLLCHSSYSIEDDVGARDRAPPWGFPQKAMRSSLTIDRQARSFAQSYPVSLLGCRFSVRESFPHNFLAKWHSLDMGADSPPWGLRWRASTLFIVATVAVGLFTDLFLYGLIVPILPFMLRDRVGLPEEKVQSYVSTMLATYAGANVTFSLPAGVIADKVKTRQAPFLSGLAALLAATLMLAFGKSIPVLMLARALQGTSSAFVWTVGLAMVLDTVGPGDLGKTIGSVGSPKGSEKNLWTDSYADLLPHFSR